ncbi:hypothetical protein [Armatimonas sp.]|uniref:hypothetical protein n=1 Tax=Armatimonas sp. TaxID=1872638 RepID=UPI00286B6750|nr:hypothetical protein [Armatimonas sp.]
MSRSYQRLQALQEEVEEALEDGDLPLARQRAQEWLEADTDPTAWHYGNTIHNANQFLGLVAVREGDLEAAKRYLLAAGNSPGSPQLNTFGPQMHLAQTLLSREEGDCVLEYLDLVAKFWCSSQPVPNLFAQLLSRYGTTQNARKLMHWKLAIQAGEQPRLNRVNLV